MLGNVMWSDSCSGQFTQLRTYVCHEKEQQREKSRMFLFKYATIILPFPSQNTPCSSKQFVVTRYQHYWERSLIHSSKRCSRRNVYWKCVLIEIPSCLPRWNITKEYRWLVYGTLVFIVAKTNTVYGRSQDILLLNRTKPLLYFFYKIPIVHRFFLVSRTL